MSFLCKQDGHNELSIV